MNIKSLSFKTLSLAITFVYTFTSITYAAPGCRSALRQPATAVTKAPSTDGVKRGFTVANLAAIIALSLLSLPHTTGSAAQKENPPLIYDIFQKMIKPPTSEPNAVEGGHKKTTDFLQEAIRKAEGEPNDVQAMTEEARIQALINQFGGEDVSAHSAAIKELTRMGGPKVVQALIDALKDAEARKAAVFILGELGDPKAVPFLGGLLGSGDWQFCLEIVEALSKIDDPLVEQVFTDALKNGRYLSARPSIILGLGRVGGPQSVELLKRISREDESPYLRLCAERALEQIRERISAAAKEHSAEGARPITIDWGSRLRPLQSIIRSFSKYVQAAVNEEIAKLGKEKAATREKITPPEEIVPPETKISEPIPAEPNKQVEAAIEAKAPEVTLPVTAEQKAPIEAAKGVEIEPAKPHISPIIASHIRDLSNSRPSVYLRAVGALVESGQDAVGPLGAVLGDKEKSSPNARRLAAEALGRIHGPEAVKTEAVKFIIANGLGDKDPQVRLSVTRALIENRRFAAGPLKEVVRDKGKDQDIRSHAESALQHIRFKSAAEFLKAYYFIGVISVAILGIAGYIFVTSTRTGRHLKRWITDRLRGRRKHEVLLINNGPRLSVARAVPGHAKAVKVEDRGPSESLTTRRIEHVVQTYFPDDKSGKEQNPSNGEAAARPTITEPTVSLETRAAQMAVDMIAAAAAAEAEKNRDLPDEPIPSPIDDKLLEQLLGQLGDKELSIRMRAACALAKAGNEKAFLVLMEILQLPGDSPAMRHLRNRALGALNGMGAKAAGLIGEMRMLATDSPHRSVRQALNAIIENIRQAEQKAVIVDLPDKATVLRPTPKSLTAIEATA